MDGLLDIAIMMQECSLIQSWMVKRSEGETDDTMLRSAFQTESLYSLRSVASPRRHCHVVLHGPFQRDFGGVNVLPGSVFEPF